MLFWMTLGIGLVFLLLLLLIGLWAGARVRNLRELQNMEERYFRGEDNAEE
jgi:hypothetical protein